MKKMFTGAIALTAIAGLALTGCSSASQATEAGDWTAAPVMENLQEQAKPFTTYALPDSWANYGALFETFCEENELDCDHVDSDMSSGEAIQRYAAEKGNPIGYLSDIGGLWGPVAEGAGVTAPYIPAGAENLKPASTVKRAAGPTPLPELSGSSSMTQSQRPPKHGKTCWATSMRTERSRLPASANQLVVLSKLLTSQSLLLAAAMSPPPTQPGSTSTSCSLPRTFRTLHQASTR